MRLTPKLFISLSKVFANQRGTDWFFVIKEVYLLFFYIIRRNPPHYNMPSQAVYFREMKTKKLVLLEVSSLSMIRIFDNTVNVNSELWKSCWKYVYLDFIYLPFLDFFVIWNIVSNNMSQRVCKVSCNMLFDICEE